ncbi:MAG: hypothetical protein MI717_00425 [Spirochaetales bacterium]|nr:hypothetical protein [Spirochaetales bacterium]
MSPETINDHVSSQHIAEFASITRQLIHGSRLFIDEGAVVEILVNPASGLLKQGRAHKKMMTNLRNLAKARKTATTPRSGLEVRFHETESPESAGEKAVQLVQELVASEKSGRRVLILAGGDGFHRDIGTALLSKAPQLMKEIALFRLPMGTGNDNADAATVEEAFALLNQAQGTREDALIEITTAQNETHYTFNVVSLGLDAFISRLTNRMKSLAGPRTIYKLITDISVFSYKWIWPLLPFTLQITHQGKTTKRQGKFLLTVFGRKGDTRYGGGMKVLPGPENFVLVNPLTLPEMLRIKPLFYRGAHRGLPFTEFFTCDEVSLDYPGPILMEMDGEDLRLEKEDFPVRFRRLPAQLHIID